MCLNFCFTKHYIPPGMCIFLKPVFMHILTYKICKFSDYVVEIICLSETELFGIHIGLHTIVHTFVIDTLIGLFIL